MRRLQYADQARSILGILIVVIGFGSMLVWRLPVQLAFASMAIGAVAGSLLLSKEWIVQFVGAAVLAFGIQHVTDRADTFGPSAQWWQPGLLVAGAACAIYLLTALVIRRIRPSSRTSA